jgi:hypothetical protein|tara:strand:+ start:30 stop:215 length:186 start_codon:yes stop_codon:yes gene_type:complete
MHYFESKMSTTEVDIETEVSKMSQKEIHLIQWEEWALSIEEHYHAQELYKRNPTGHPMGHR